MPAAPSASTSRRSPGPVISDTILRLSLLGATRRIEVKRRATGLKQIYAWLANADIVVARVDRKEAVVVLPLSLALQIAAKAEAINPQQS